jgi:hypothetical protein
MAKDSGIVVCSDLARRYNTSSMRIVKYAYPPLVLILSMELAHSEVCNVNCSLSNCSEAPPVRRAANADRDGHCHQLKHIIERFAVVAEDDNVSFIDLHENLTATTGAAAKCGITAYSKLRRQIITKIPGPGIVDVTSNRPNATSVLRSRY